MDRAKSPEFGIATAAIQAPFLLAGFGEASFFAGAAYAPRVLGQMAKGAGEFHAFPEAVRAFESLGTVRNVKGGDGIVRQMLEIPGGYKTTGGRSVEGVFQFLRESDGSISHRLFVPR